jgi:hypothetical protein
MFSKSLAVGLVALACVTAAAGGAYMAARHNEPAAGVATAPASLAPAQPAPAVQDTEAVVAPPAGAPAPLEKADTPPAPAPAAKLVDTPVRPKPASPPSTVSRRVDPRAAPPVNRSVTPAPEAPASTSRPAATSPAEPAPAVRADLPAPVDPLRTDAPRPEPPPPSAPELVELEIPAASVIGLQIETPVTTETARIEDRVEARVMRDVAVDGRTAIPAGTRALGAVTVIERGGKVKERARLGVRFHTLVLADGTQLPIRTDAIIREGESPAGDSARKIGGAAVGGAILGALIGGKKGAIVGGATGAAGGTAVVYSGDRNAATLPAGAVVTVRLSAPVAVEVEKK